MPDGDASMRAIELDLLAELPDDDRRRGHRQCAADDDRNRQWDVETPTERRSIGRRRQDTWAPPIPNASRRIATMRGK